MQIHQTATTVSVETLIGTGLLFLATVKLANVSKRSSEMDLRAYVSIREIAMTANMNSLSANMIDSWRIRPVWENNGKTPTRNLTCWTNYKRFSQKNPKESEFKDVHLGQDPLVFPHLIIGPLGHIQGEDIHIPANEIQTALSGNEHIFVWGWAEYDDMITRGKPHHRTEFCVYITTLGDPTLNGSNLLFNFHTFHNGFDDEIDWKYSPVLMYRKLAPFRQLLLRRKKI